MLEVDGECSLKSHVKLNFTRDTSKYPNKGRLIELLLAKDF